LPHSHDMWRRRSWGQLGQDVVQARRLQRKTLRGNGLATNRFRHAIVNADRLGNIQIAHSSSFSCPNRYRSYTLVRPCMGRAERLSVLGLSPLPHCDSRRKHVGHDEVAVQSESQQERGGRSMDDHNLTTGFRNSQIRFLSCGRARPVQLC